jgi:ferredoxin
MEKHKISRRNALRMLGAMCAGTVLSSRADVLSASTRTKVKAEEPTEKYKRLIFFFSATGNSLYIAKELSGAEGTLMSIPQEIHNEHPVYEAEEIGIVCPIYCFIPPTIVQEFFARSTFKANYLFCVGTYGANSTIFPEYVAQMAKDKGLEMNYINTIKMVDTYLPYYDMEKEKAADKQIPENLAAIKASINSRENFIRPVSKQEKMMCEGYYRYSGRDRVKPTFTRSEKLVYSTDECIGCGICNSVCPHGSWKIVNGKSVAEGDCENCLSCVHNCPKKAISIIRVDPEPEEQNRNSRYRNPNVRVGEIILANSQVNYNG